MQSKSKIRPNDEKNTMDVNVLFNAVKKEFHVAKQV